MDNVWTRVDLLWLVMVVVGPMRETTASGELPMAQHWCRERHRVVTSCELPSAGAYLGVRRCRAQSLRALRVPCVSSGMR